MDEHEPINAAGFVYRRIHPAYFDPTLPIPVQRAAFRPNQNDTTGVTVIRASVARPEDSLPNDPAKAKGYYVARLAVRDLRNLGLTVVPEPIAGGPPGHAVIPELSWAAYQVPVCEFQTVP